MFKSAYIVFVPLLAKRDYDLSCFNVCLMGLLRGVCAQRDIYYQVPT